MRPQSIIRAEPPLIIFSPEEIQPVRFPAAAGPLNQSPAEQQQTSSESQKQEQQSKNEEQGSSSACTPAAGPRRATWGRLRWREMLHSSPRHEPNTLPLTKRHQKDRQRIDRHIWVHGKLVQILLDISRLALPLQVLIGLTCPVEISNCPAHAHTSRPVVRTHTRPPSHTTGREIAASRSLWRVGRQKANL